MKHEAEIQQQAIAETPCTEAAPCFACMRCAIRLLNLIPEAARKTEAPIPAADGGGQWTPAPEKPDHYTFGPLSAERTITLTTFTATLPAGKRVHLPAGTVLRGGDRITFERTIRPEHMPPPGLEDGAVLATVGPEGAIVPADPDPWLAGLTLAAYNAARSGLDRGIGAKAGLAAMMTAYTTGVERAIADHAKPRR